MKIFFGGPLTDLSNPTKTKKFYKKLADIASNSGVDWFWAFMNGTDPVVNPNVPPADVYHLDINQLAKSTIMVAYVGEPSTGTGIEIEYAHDHGIPVVLLYPRHKKISRMLRGCPGIIKEIVYKDDLDAFSQLNAFLKSLKESLATHAASTQKKQLIQAKLPRKILSVEEPQD